MTTVPRSMSVVLWFYLHPLDHLVHHNLPMCQAFRRIRHQNSANQIGRRLGKCTWQVILQFEDAFVSVFHVRVLKRWLCRQQGAQNAA